MADQASIGIRSARVVQRAGEDSQQYGVEIQVVVANTGDVVWTKADHFLRGRILSADGSFEDDPECSGSILPNTGLAEEQERTLTVWASPRTPEIAPEQFLQVDTRVEVDVVGPTGYIGDPLGAFYLRDFL